MADKYQILAATDYNVRAQIAAALNDISARVDNIVTFLQLEPNVMAIGVGTDPTWIIVDGLVPVVDAGFIGLNPPTVSGGDTITINSAGYYDVSVVFGIDIGSGGNTVVIEILKNGATTLAVEAGVEFSGGQAAPINQPTATTYDHFDVGDTITFEATELGTDDKLLYWNLSGGTITQTAFDWDAINP
jgi:hypothetical protein